ncbi:MAG TPA: hypothetical protein VIH71_15730 [Solirubrobacteraceae bacterium]
MTLDLRKQPESILLLTRHPAEIVKNHVGRFQLGELGQHVLECRASEIGASTPKLHILSNYPRSKSCSVTLAGFALTLDGVALRVIARELARARYPQVDHGGGAFISQHRPGLIFCDGLCHKSPFLVTFLVIFSR